MIEPRRQAFLDAMGVVSYVPRFVLVNARPSPRCAMPSAPSHVPDPVVATPAGPSAESPAPVAEARVPRPALDLPGVLSPSPVARVERDHTSKPVRFTADLVASQLGLMFVSEGGLTPEQKRLLANIAKAFSRHFLQDRAPGLQASRFSWPVTQSPGLAQGVDAARDALSANLLAQAERFELRWVVLFGDTLQPYVDTRLLAAEGIALLHCVAVAELLSQATAKADLWRALRQAATAGAERP